MEPQTVKIEVAPIVAHILNVIQQRAEAEGVSVESLLLSLVPQNGDLREEASFEMSPEQRAEELVEWLKAHSVKGVVADDSRDSIYTREDEAI